MARPEKMAHDVFVSYSSHNKTEANAVCAMLEANDVRCWIAPRDVTPGLEYGECIIDAIEQSRIVVLVFTAEANKSPQVRKEVERAVNRGLTILPLRIENVLPGRALEFFIGNVHWLDALTPPLQVHLERLTKTVLTMLSRQPEPRPVPTPYRDRRWWLYGTATALIAILAAYSAIRALSYSHHTNKSQAQKAATSRNQQDANRPVKDVMAGSQLNHSEPATASQPLTTASSQNEKNTNRTVKDDVVAGNQWHATTTKEIPNLYSISGTPDGKHLWTVGHSATILQSDDLGATWHARASGATRPSLQWILVTAYGNHLWTFDGRILQSDDGGMLWRARENVSGDDVSSMFGTADGLHLWMAGGQWKLKKGGGYGTVTQSDDGGATWRVKTGLGSDQLNSIFGTADGKHLWTVGGDFILQSDDAGVTWASRINVPDEHFSTILCTPNGGHVWAVGGDVATPANGEAGHFGANRGRGTVARSGDGGATWQVQKNLGDSRLSSIFGTADGNHLWAVGGNSILQSDDGGATWRVKTGLGSDQLNSIFGTADGKHLWVAAGDGLILHSNAPSQ